VPKVTLENVCAKSVSLLEKMSKEKEGRCRKGIPSVKASVDSIK